MNFDFTHGNPAKYGVFIHYEFVSDRLYYSTFKEAKAKFDKLCGEEHKKGTVVTLNDIVKDIRKGFKKF